jgi:hypothetical protein
MLAFPKEFGCKVPYCWECLGHVETGRGVKRECVAQGPAVGYHGFQGSIHKLSFGHWQYANRFVLLNHEKLVGF